MDEFQPVVTKTHIDPDILKIDEIEKVMSHFEGLDFPQDFMRANIQLLTEYRNAIVLGVCPNFVRTYNEKYNAKIASQS